MDLIQQAVFTSAETDRLSGYQVVAASEGVSKADVRELNTWCPSHNAILGSQPKAASINFHPLPSGSYCVSRTTPGGREYSGRGGVRVYTQCLIVPPKTLARFANNPFALVRAAMAGGALRLYDEVPGQLAPIRLVGRAAAVDATLLTQLHADPGPTWMASLVQAVLNSTSVALVGDSSEQFIPGLFNCLPVECRTAFSFSTGLKYSPRRPFRLFALPCDREEQRRVARLYQITVLDVTASPPDEFAPEGAWARFVERVLKLGRTSLFVNRFAEDHGDLAPNDLDALGLQCLEDFDAESTDTLLSENGLAAKETPRLATTDAEPPAPLTRATAPSASRESARKETPKPGGLQKAHKAHSPGNRESLRASCREEAPSGRLQSDDPKVIERLEELDDLVFDAVDGKPEALERLRAFWPEACEHLGEMIVESQAQYLRYALSVWDTNAGNLRDPGRAVHALEVLQILFADS